MQGPVRRSLTLLLIVALTCAQPCRSELPASSGERSFSVATPGYRYEFPRDHGSHDNFQTEWWYYTGHLRTASGKRFGYQLTLFRRAVSDERVWRNPSRWAVRHLYFGHLALSDVSRGQFRFVEKLSRAGLGKAGAETNRLRTWIDHWSIEAVSADHRQHRLIASAD